MYHRHRKEIKIDIKIFYIFSIYPTKSVTCGFLHGLYKAIVWWPDLNSRIFPNLLLPHLLPLPLPSCPNWGCHYPTCFLQLTVRKSRTVFIYFIFILMWSLIYDQYQNEIRIYLKYFSSVNWYLFYWRCSGRWIWSATTNTCLASPARVTFWTSSWRSSWCCETWWRSPSSTRTGRTWSTCSITLSWIPSGKYLCLSRLNPTLDRPATERNGFILRIPTGGVTSE